MKSEILAQKFLALGEKRTAFVGSLSSLSESDLWKQTAPDAWSVGHHLVHLAMALRLIRRVESFTLPVQRFCIPFCSDTLETEPAADIFLSGAYKPRKTASSADPLKQRFQPAPLASILMLLDYETARLKSVLADLTDNQAGRMLLYFGPRGWINLHQLIGSISQHEQHHFRLAKAIGAELKS